MSQPVILAVPLDKENVDPQTDPSTSDLSQTSAPTEPKRAATISIIPAPPAAADDEQATTASSSSDGSSQKKKRKQPATAPRTLSKEELADYIARDEFWQKCEAAEGDGDGYEFARGEGDEEDEPVYDDCNEVRRKITAFLKTGRMTQTALLKLLNVNGGSFQRFMKQKVSPTYKLHPASHAMHACFASHCSLTARRYMSAIGPSWWHW